MKWRYNCMTWNDIGFYKGRQIVRLEGGGIYNAYIRHGLDRIYTTFKSLKKCMDAINDELKRTNCKRG